MSRLSEKRQLARAVWYRDLSSATPAQLMTRKTGELRRLIRRADERDIQAARETPAEQPEGASDGR